MKKESTITKRPPCYSSTRILAVIFLLLYLLHFIHLYLQVHTVKDKDVTTTTATTTATKHFTPIVNIDFQEELQKSQQYVDSIQSTHRNLVFVHIPKTAGTTIEEVGGKQAKLSWGSCRFNHKPKRRGNVCLYPPGQFEWPMKIGWWHIPTQLFPLHGSNPYQNVDLFGVIRNPLDRLISEFYYLCRKKVTKWWDEVECNRTEIYNATYMNQWLHEKLLQQPEPTTSDYYLHYNGHYTPQYDFIVAPGEIRMIDYVLQMDQLQTSFPKLMNAFDIGHAVLPTQKYNEARNATMDLTSRHFDAQTLSLIREKYLHDVTKLYPNATTEIL